MSWLWNHLVDAIPLWIWLPLVAVAALAVFRLLGFRASALVAAIGAVFMAYQTGRRKKAEDIRERRKRELEEQKRKHEEISNRVDGMSREELEKELRRNVVKGDKP